MQHAAPTDEEGCGIVSNRIGAAGSRPQAKLHGFRKKMRGALTTDQRGDGFARVINGRIDIGAFEKALEYLIFLPLAVRN